MKILNRQIHIFVLLFLQSFFNSVIAQKVVITTQGDTLLLFEDGTYREVINSAKIDSSLLKKIQKIGQEVNANGTQIQQSYQLAKQGWRYTLPQPKSRQAAWGNNDGRTTWWYGYWYNETRHVYSKTKPKKSKSGLYIGDGQKLNGYYRNGGSPPYPSKIELILSKIN